MMSSSTCEEAGEIYTTLVKERLSLQLKHCTEIDSNLFLYCVSDSRHKERMSFGYDEFSRARVSYPTDELSH